MSKLRSLLDTNILIHREASTVTRDDIGTLFKWLDNLAIQKCVHPVSVGEIQKHGDSRIVKSFELKLGNYHVLKTLAPLARELQVLSSGQDKTPNDLNDTAILNEVFCGRVDLLITEDKKILTKAEALGIGDKVFRIDAFLEKVTAENPELADYKVLAVKKEHFGNIDVTAAFFDSLRADYKGFDRWFTRKSDETAYVCREAGELVAFLYLKVESPDENYADITPTFARKKRLKIGCFKVASNGFRLGERFLKIAFDNALSSKVEEIYVTAFDSAPEKLRLINLLEEFGFSFFGTKGSDGEKVFVRSFEPRVAQTKPKSTFPYFSLQQTAYLVPIYPDYHTELLPDSILRTESPIDFAESEPHRNAISKVYISRSIERSLVPGDIIVFYRTGGYYKSVVTTIGIVEKVVDKIPDAQSFLRLCRKRSVFSDAELLKHWNYNQSSRPFIVNFLYAYSFPKRINLERLIQVGVIADVGSAPRGFVKIRPDQLQTIMKECQVVSHLAVS